MPIHEPKATNGLPLLLPPLTLLCIITDRRMDDNDFVIGDSIALDVSRSTFWNVVSDGMNGLKNKVQIEGDPLPGQFMVIMNSDEQLLSLDLGEGEVANIPSGYTVMVVSTLKGFQSCCVHLLSLQLPPIIIMHLFQVHNGVRWTDLRSLNTEAILTLSYSRNHSLLQL